MARETTRTDDRPTRPDAEALAAAQNRKVADIIAPGLKVLFCGINPGLYSAAVGHHFARPGNRFWPTLFAAGFTPRLLMPAEERELLSLGYGITNIVDVYVRHLRAKIDDGHEPKVIRTVRGVGYMISAGEES